MCQAIAALRAFKFMRYLDYGYAIFYEDIKESITWKQLSEYLVGIGRPELLNRYDSSEYPRI